MEISYSAHAEEQINERKIEKDWVKETIRSPDHTQKKTPEKYILRKKLNGISIEVVYVRGDIEKCCAAKM